MGSWSISTPPARACLAFPKAVEIALYRMAQEALTNATKHASPKAVSILIHRNPTEVRLVIEDDGKGFDASEILSEAQLGLVGMRERAHLIGGSMTVESSPGNGTTICVSVPLPGAEAGCRHEHPGVHRGRSWDPARRPAGPHQRCSRTWKSSARRPTAPRPRSASRATEPDVVLMDISMPNGGGLAAIAAVKEVRPKTRILVLTVHDELGYVRAAGQAGAVGYVVKSAVDTELLAAIRAVAQGRTFMDASLGLGFAQSSRRASSTDDARRNRDGAADRARAGGHAACRGGLHQLTDCRRVAAGRQVGRDLSFESHGKAGVGLALRSGQIRARLRRSQGRHTNPMTRSSVIEHVAGGHNESL